ncbi:hypothetical protein PSY53_23650, partial [Shigella flexneri]|nr:hypothetical protein [Shigella flexneri]
MIFAKNLVVEQNNLFLAPYTVLLGSKFICNVDLTAVLKIHKLAGKEITTVYKKVSPDLASEYDTILRFDETG